mgnify:FL=1
MIGPKYRKRVEPNFIVLAGIHMSDTQEKLRQLLDGKLDASEITNDPVLISLAERIYGLDMKEIMGDEYPGNEENTNSDLFVEIVESDASDAIPEPEISIPEPLPPPAPQINIPKLFLPISLALRILGPLTSIMAIANIFGAFSFLSSGCSGYCPTGNGRISWFDIYRLNTEFGWVETGSFGAPTVVIVLGGVFMFWFGKKLKQIHKSANN